MTTTIDELIRHGYTTGKLNPEREATLRAKTMELEQGPAFVRAYIATLRPLAGAATSGPRAQAAPLHSPAQYEDYPPDDLARLRASGDDGEDRYRQLRASWEERGRPRLTAVGSGSRAYAGPTARYEDFTSDQIARMRASGELSPEGYESLRASWQERGRPPLPVGDDAA
jgi:hypothetical protein